MFWESVMGGLGMLTHWETYVAVAEALLITWSGPMVIMGISAFAGRAAGLMGCFTMILIPLLQTFGVMVLVVTLSPLILQFNDHAAWAMPWQLANIDWWMTFKFVGLALLATVIIAFIPIIGQFQSLGVLVVGVLALALVLGIYDNMNNGIVDKKVHFWPGWLFGIGLVLAGTILGSIGLLCAAAIGQLLGSRWEGSPTMIAMPISMAFGFLPVFIYGSWLALQLHAP